MGNLLKRSSLDRRSCEFLTATLTGDDSLMPEESRATFTASGLAHILLSADFMRGHIVGCRRHSPAAPLSRPKT